MSRSLFIKIFLWFWLANLVVIAALALVIWMYPYTAAPHPGPLHKLHELQVRGALAVRDSKGQEAFEQHRQWLEQASALRTYWFDESGREITGQAVPERVLNISERSEPETIDRPDEGRPPFPFVYRLTDGAGHGYIAVAEPLGPAPPRPYDLFVPPKYFVPRLLAVIVTAGLGCYGLARYLTAPVRRLQQAARRLAAGDLSVRAGARLTARRDEIGEFGREFDRMAQQLETLLTTQRRLLQDVSHELRSPLARLNVALEIARRDSGPAGGPALTRAGQEAERLNELIGQVLMLARLEGTSSAERETSIDLAALVTEVAADADFEAAASERRVRVLGCDACSILGTLGLLRSAIENVVRNAVRFTPSGTQVEIRLSYNAEGEPGALIEVRDHGPGVPLPALQDIFRPFYRVQDGRERQTGGTGLGLAITERAVRLHGGAVQASNSPTGGLVVQVKLPRASPAE